MKIRENIAIYSGINTEESDRKARGVKEEGKRSVYVGGFSDNLLQNNILQRKKQAQQKAMKVVGDVFAGDLSIDEDLKERMERVKGLEAENLELQKEISDIDSEQEHLKKRYGITEDSEEQKELELLRKAQNEVGRVILSPEELKQASKIEEKGLSEYQQRSLELDDRRKICLKKKEENSSAIVEENAIIKGIRQERLKYAPMVKAQKQAEAIKEAVSKEIIGMVIEDAKENIDEDVAEREERAEKQAEKQEQEELLEKMPMEELLQLEQMKTDVKEEVQSIVDKMNLVAEDIKGAAVDQTV